MFNKRILAAVGTVAAAGALALTAAGTAFAVNPPNVPVSVLVTPNHFSGQQGTAISPLAVTDDRNQFLIDAGAVVTLSQVGLPAGVHLDGTTGPTTISGTPTVSGSGTAVVTATAVESNDTHIRDLGPKGLNFPGCSYSISAPASTNVSGDSTASDQITTIAIDPTSGQITYTLVDNDGPTVTTSGLIASLSEINYKLTGDETATVVTVAKTCKASADVSWAVAAAPTPGPTVTVTPPPPSTPLSGTPSGGVQTGAVWYPQNRAPLAFGLLGLAVLGGGLILLPLRRRSAA